MQWKKKIKKLLKSEKEPDKVAKGFALGVFIGFLPIYGFQMLLAVLVAGITRVSKIPAIIGTHVTNPWTAIPVLIIDYYIGCLVLGIRPKVPQVELTKTSLFALGRVFLLPTFVGGIILGTIFSVLSYLGIRRFIEKEISAIKRTLKRHKT